ncbi:hypothetical protein [Candidatus Methylomirabilis sp.]|uniref:hypothetical protein n=1 Tax=Candidatus Methylomirabilis sp. TaxID=2032687 RepID=UPI002A62AE73|nr:hypothetical protein [Candidatus Methylomirabilis sp.]
MKKSTLLSALAVSLFVAAPVTPVMADPPDPIRAAIDAGADRLIDIQNPDGGWDWRVGFTDCGGSCPNLFGVTALGLVDAYRVTHDSAQLAAAARAADALIAKHAAGPVCDSNPSTSADRPYTVDTSFLMDISHLGRVGSIVGPAGKKNYRNVAKAWFACVMADFPSAAARADNRISGRISQGLNNLGAWDASLDIRAAMDVHQRAYALAEALQVIARASDWDVVDPDCPGCENLSKGLFLAATHELQGDPTIRSTRNAWKGQLLAAQSLDGSWGGDTQTTAYIVMGLAETSQGKPTRTAIKAAVGFLLTQQNSLGGFNAGTTDSTEYGEVDGEVLQALFAADEDD